MISQTHSPTLLSTASPTPETLMPSKPLEGSSFTQLLAHFHSLLNNTAQLSEGLLPPTMSVLQSPLTALDAVDAEVLPHLILSAASLTTTLSSDPSVEESDAGDAQEEQAVFEQLLALFRDQVDVSPETAGIQLRIDQASVGFTSQQRHSAEHQMVVTSEQTPGALPIQSGMLHDAQRSTPAVARRMQAASVASDMSAKPLSFLLGSQPPAGAVEAQPPGSTLPVSGAPSTVLQPTLDTPSILEQTVHLTDVISEDDTRFAHPTRFSDAVTNVEPHSAKTRQLNDTISGPSRTPHTTSPLLPQTSYDNAASLALVDAMDPFTPAADTPIRALDVPEPSTPRGFTALPPDTAARLLGHPLPRNSIMLQLEPPELGFVQVQVRVHHESLSATFWADSPEVRTLLHTHLPVLNQALQEQGFDTSDISISLASGSFAEHSGQFEQQHTRFSGSIALAEERMAAAPDSRPLHDARHLGRSAGQAARLVDLVI